MQDLEAIAAKLLETARKLPAGPVRHDVLKQIGKFRARITALKVKANDDEDFADPCRDHWLFGICPCSNRGAQGWRQAAEAGKAGGTNGLQTRKYGQRDQALGRDCVAAPEPTFLAR